MMMEKIPCTNRLKLLWHSVLAYRGRCMVHGRGWCFGSNKSILHMIVSIFHVTIGVWYQYLSNVTNSTRVFDACRGLCLNFVSPLAAPKTSRATVGWVAAAQNKALHVVLLFASIEGR